MLQNYIPKQNRNHVIHYRNRYRVTIVGNILEVVSAGVKKTKIMFLANLSFTVLEKYLGIAIDAGLVQLEGNIYFLTAKGQDFLNQQKRFDGHCIKARKILENLDNEHIILEQYLGK